MALDANIDESSVQAEVVEEHIIATVDQGIMTEGKIVSSNQNGSAAVIEEEEIRARVISPGASSGVSSVNGRTGDVELTKSDVGLENVDNVRQYSSSNPPPYPVRSVNNRNGDIQLSKSDVGLGNVDNVQQYSSTNPPPYPVTSVNNQTGDVQIAIPTNADIVNLIYPVGSIYLSLNSTSPATLFGGTWEQIQDRFLLAAGPTYTAGATGGEATHKLTVTEMPSHTHNIYGGNGDPPDWFGGSGNAYGIKQRTGTAYDYLQYVGGNGAHNNMPPYLVVYIWKRTA